MQLKQHQKQGIGLMMAGIGSMFGVLSNRLPEAYKLPGLLIAITILAAGIIFVFKSQKTTNN